MPRHDELEEVRGESAGGASISVSEIDEMSNVAYPGTTRGPPPWSTFFANAAAAARAVDFDHAAYAHDLTPFRAGTRLL
eukprot:12639135-Alexandrium_andersonii.AAC.1